MAERFYTNCPLAPGPFVLEGPEAHHLAAVRRVRPGDRVYLFNGDGRQYPAEVRAASRKGVELDVLAAEAADRELPFVLEVAAPLPKGDRAQFLVEKLTELGVTRYRPLRTSRSVVHPRDARLERLQRWVVEASKQCGRNVLMAVEALADWEDYCRRRDLPEVKVVAHPEDATAGANVQRPTSNVQRPTLSAGLLDVGRSSVAGLAVAVGPEGGFTDEEVGRARAAGWRLVGLGPRTLRVETAALALAAAATLAGPGP